MQPGGILADPPPCLTGPLAERYRLERELGHGGMATVYLARDLRHDRLVAIKILRRELAMSMGSERFLREIQIAARLSHPNILPLHDSGEADGCLCYVMPYVEGESLRDRLDREGSLNLDAALRITREVAEALAYAHKHGIVHRDIKPENILLAEGHAVVSDFGIARAIDAAGGGRMTTTGVVIGTPAYMSPEQATGSEVDARSDLYSLGCVVFEMLAGQPPHSGPTPAAVLFKRLSGPAPSVRATRDAVPEAVDRAVQSALAPDPNDRFPSVTEFLQAIEPAMPQHTGATGSVAASAPAPGRSRRWLMIAGIAIAAALPIGMMLTRERGPALASTRLAILPFAIRGDSGFEYLGEGIVDLLARSLDGAGNLRTVDPGTVLSAVGTDHAVMDPERRRTVARRVGAGNYLFGTIHAVGNRLRIQAGIYDARSGDGSAVSQLNVEGDATEVLALVDQLAARLLVERGETPGRLFHAATLTTQSLPALKNFLTAEQSLRSGPAGIDSAIAGFQRAVSEDSTFALAYYRLAVASGWQLRHEVASAATAAALRHSTRLAERDRRLLQAYGDYRAGRVAEAEPAFRDLVRDDPGDLEAAFQLADLLAYYNPLRGRSQAEPLELFQRVLGFDPGFLCPI